VPEKVLCCQSQEVPIHLSELAGGLEGRTIGHPEVRMEGGQSLGGSLAPEAPLFVVREGRSDGWWQMMFAREMTFAA